MNLSIMEDAVIYAALKRYCEFCSACLENPENEQQFSAIRGDLQIAESLLPKIRQNYLSQGGLADLL